MLHFIYLDDGPRWRVNEVRRRRTTASLRGQHRGVTAQVSMDVSEGRQRARCSVLLNDLVQVAATGQPREGASESDLQASSVSGLHDGDL